MGTETAILMNREEIGRSPGKGAKTAQKRVPREHFFKITENNPEKRKKRVQGWRECAYWWFYAIYGGIVPRKLGQKMVVFGKQTAFFVSKKRDWEM